MAQSTAQSIGAGLSGLAVRNGVNENLGALFTNSSGAAAPTVIVGGMFWLDTDATPPTLYQRNAANTAWRVVSQETMAPRTIWGNNTASALAAKNVTVPELLTLQGFLQDPAVPYCIFPGPGGTGMALQAGQGTTGALGATVTFPLAYDQIPRLTTVCVKATAGFITVQSIGLTGFYAQGWNADGVQVDTFFQWQAFGRYY